MIRITYTYYIVYPHVYITLYIYISHTYVMYIMYVFFITYDSFYKCQWDTSGRAGRELGNAIVISLFRPTFAEVWPLPFPICQHIPCRNLPCHNIHCAIICPDVIYSAVNVRAVVYATITCPAVIYHA